MAESENKFAKTAKGLGSAILSIVALIVIFLLIALMLRGMAWIMDRVFPWLLLISNITIALCFLVLLPLSFFRRMWTFTAMSLYIASYVLGFWTWCYGFAIAYSIWGWVGVVVGLFFGGVGVVPVAMIAALIKGQWAILLNLAIYCVLTFGTRFYALFVAAREDNRKEQVLNPESRY